MSISKILGLPNMFSGGRSPWEGMNNEPSGNDFSPTYNFRKFFDNFGGAPQPSLKILAIIPVLLIIFWLTSGFFKVEEGEQAVVLRFGKFDRVATSGLNYHLPSPIESFIKEQVTKSRKTEIGFRAKSSGKNNLTSINGASSSSAKQSSPKSSENSAHAVSHSSIPEESIMLTGDENLVEVNCNVMWYISDLKNYLFNVSYQEDMVKDAAESATRQIIGKTPLEDSITNKKGDIEKQIENLTQSILDLYGAGITIDEAQLLKVDAPAEVVDAFRDVQAARAERETIINQANTYYNRVTLSAEGEASKIIQAAKGYSETEIAKAYGATERFNDVLNKYTNHKQITRDRLWLDAIEHILSGSKKTILNDPKGVLPHYSLNNNPRAFANQIRNNKSSNSKENKTVESYDVTQHQQASSETKTDEENNQK
jgi:membrane protease subunit HflK